MADLAVLYDPEQGKWLRYTHPVAIHEVHDPKRVLPSLHQIEEHAREDGLFAVGFVSYEAAGAFDPALVTHASEGFPLLRFGLFPMPQPVDLDQNNKIRQQATDWQPSLDLGAFCKAITAIHAAIAAGETYQVNVTFPLQTTFDASPWDFFCQLVRGQRAPAAGYLEAGRWTICSASPELFFHRTTGRLVMRPMKGTAPRGRTLDEDRLLAKALRTSTKNRAENVMILDMVRNDLGRLAPPGAVTVEELFSLEKYPTLWQMTSTASAASTASLAEIMRALFPCASITGAPKARTMQIIRKLENQPRRIYTGTFGWLAPDGTAHFNVAIRTALIDRDQQLATYGVGAGITWDSQSVEEYRECLTKAEILTRPRPQIALIETLRWTPRHGYYLLQEHLARLQDSAEYFDIPCDPDAIARHLEDYARILPGSAQRVRLLLHDNGRLEQTATSLQDGEARRVLRLGLADQSIDRQDHFLYHKTTERLVYDRTLAAHPGCDDVILWNDRGEATETCNGNLVLEVDGVLVTPPVDCGLLAGTYRAHLLARGVISERVVTLDDLERSTAIYRINAVRKWQNAVIVP